MVSISKIVILGHRGFIGHHLYRQFSKEACWETSGFSSGEVDLLAPEAVEDFFHTLDSKTVLIFCAAIGRAWQDDHESFLKNVALFAHVAAAIKKYPLRQCIFLSSVDVYGVPKQLPLNESSPAQPHTLYGWAKLTGEFLLRETLTNSPTVLTILRLSGVYGVGERSKNPINLWIRSALERGCIELFGDGTERRDYVWLPDLYPILCCLVKQSLGGVFNVATGESYSLLEMIEQLKKIFSKPIEIVHLERRRSWLDYQFDASQLKKVTAPFSFTPLPVGLKMLCEGHANG